MPEFIVENTRVGDIPVLTVARARARRLPLVLFLHGFGADKRAGLELGYTLAERGFFFAAFDAPHHGARLDDVLRRCDEPRPDKNYPPETGLDTWCLMLETIVAAARDAESLLDAWHDDPRVDVARLGVSGVSMGGYWAHYMAAHEPRVAVAAPVVGMPAWCDRWADVTLEATSYPQWAAALAAARLVTEQRANWIAGLDPFPRLASFAPKPLLMLCGDEDVAQPKSYSVKLYRELLPYYSGHASALRLSIHEHAGHQFTRGMQEEAAAWFESWLT